MPSTLLRTVRRLVRACFRLRTAGKSLTLDFALEGKGVGPAYRAHVEPVLFFCVAAWDGWIDRGDLVRGVNGARRVLEGASSPWSRVGGPATALVATLHRVGWELVDPFRWRTHRGDVRILEVSPKAVAGLMEEAVELWLWRQVVAGAPELGSVHPTPFLEPLRSALSNGGRIGATWSRPT